MAKDELSPLLDQFGMRIKKADIDVLKSEIAAPSGFSARPPFAGHLAFGIDPGRLGAIIRSADNGQTRDWFILAEEIEELFSHYLAVLSKRKRQVALLPITVVPAADVKDAEKHADFVRRWLDTKVLEHAQFDILDALGKGYSVNEIMWENRAGVIRPAEILWRNQRDFEVSWKDGQTIWLRTADGFDDLYPHKFLLHTHTLKSGNVVRSGLTRAVCWLWMWSTYTMKDWALFVQGYGLPVRLGKYGSGASDGDKRTLWRAVRSIGGDLAAIIPDTMQMEFIESKAANDGAKLYEGRGTWLNMEVSKLVLGGTASTDATSGGHAAGRDHRAGEQDVEKFDARVLAGSVNQQIITAMVAFNFGEQDAYPTIQIGEDEKAPISDVIAAIADLGPLGFKACAQDVYDRLQLNKPEEGDDVIGMPIPTPGDPNADPGAKVRPNPHPEINPDSTARAMMGYRERRAERRERQTRQGLLGRLALNTPAQEQIMDALEARLSRDAESALASMTDRVRQCAEEAEDMEDLAKRLADLKLDPHEFQTAMMQGMTLGYLAGQADVLDDLKS